MEIEFAQQNDSQSSEQAAVQKEKVKVISTLTFKKYLLELRQNKINDQIQITNLQTYEISNFASFMEKNDEGYILISSLKQLEEKKYIPEHPKDYAEIVWQNTLNDGVVAFNRSTNRVKVEMTNKQIKKAEKDVPF